MSNRLRAALVFVCVLVLSLVGSVASQNLDRSPREDWPTYGGSFSQQRFSRLNQVTPQNVARLRVAWTFPVPDAGIIDNSLQTTPLVVRGREAGLPAFDAVMLITTPRSGVLALDASNGRQLWDVPSAAALSTQTLLFGCQPRRRLRPRAGGTRSGAPRLRGDAGRAIVGALRVDRTSRADVWRPRRSLGVGHRR